MNAADFANASGRKRISDIGLSRICVTVTDKQSAPELLPQFYHPVGSSVDGSRQMRVALAGSPEANTAILHIPIKAFRITDTMGERPTDFTDCINLPIQMKVRVAQALVADMLSCVVSHLLSWRTGSAWNSVNLYAAKGLAENIGPANVKRELTKLEACLKSLTAAEFWGTPDAIVSSVARSTIRSSANGNTMLVLELKAQTPRHDDPAAWGASASEMAARLVLCLAAMGKATRPVSVPWPTEKYSSPTAYWQDDLVGNLDDEGVPGLALEVFYRPGGFFFIEPINNRVERTTLDQAPQPKYHFPHVNAGRYAKLLGPLTVPAMMWLKPPERALDHYRVNVVVDPRSDHLPLLGTLPVGHVKVYYPASTDEDVQPTAAAVAPCNARQVLAAYTLQFDDT